MVLSAEYRENPKPASDIQIYHPGEPQPCILNNNASLFRQRKMRAYQDPISQLTSPYHNPIIPLKTPTASP